MKYTNEKGIALIHLIVVCLIALILIAVIIICYSYSVKKAEAPSEEIKKTFETKEVKRNNQKRKIKSFEDFDSVEFSFENSDNDDRVLIQEGRIYDLYDFGGTTKVKIDDETLTLKEAIDNDTLTRADIISQLVYDSNQGKCFSDSYLDGGTRVYVYEEFNVTVTNSLSYSKQKIFFSKSNLEINAFQEKYPEDENEITYDEETGIAVIGNPNSYDEDAESSPDDMVFKFASEGAKKIKELSKGKKYSICSFGGDPKIVADGAEFNLSDDIDVNVSVLEILHQLEKDANAGLCYSNYFVEDGDYREYVYRDTTVIVANKFTVEEPEIVFAPSKSEWSDVTSVYFTVKSANYTGTDYDEGLGINCKLENMINDNLWMVSIKTMDDKKIDQYVERYKKTFSLYRDVDEEDIERARSNYIEQSITHYLMDLSDVSDIERDVSEGDTLAVVFSGEYDEGYSSVEFEESTRDPSSHVTYSRVKDESQYVRDKYIVDKVFSENNCYLIRQIYQSGPSSSCNILFIRPDDIIEENALEEGAEFIVENCGGSSWGSHKYDYLSRISKVEKAK